MARPFTSEPLKPPSFWQRLFRRQPKGNAIIEIRRLLGEADHVDDVTLESVEEIAERYRVRLRRDLEHERLAVLAEYLEHCLHDRRLADEEIGRVSHLKTLLHLADEQVQKTEEEAVTNVYGSAIKKVLQDARVSEEEREFISRLESDLHLRPVVAQRVYQTHAQDLLQRQVDGIVGRGELSPQDDEDLEALAANLGVAVRMDRKTRETLDRLRLYWHIQEGELPELNPEIRLFKGERCHMIVHASWYEHRTVTRRVRYSGPMLRVKIAKGLYWRAGDISLKRVSEDILKHLDSGKVYLTERRILFRGERGNKTLRLDRIVNFEPFENGIEIEKDSGKNPFLEFAPGAEVFAMILGRLLEELEA